ncbi:MAG: phosphoglycerate dehydrogenase [Armatimonadota bacterium]|nr:phosphoglycerate dehydrogenase [Armatimonadota bacterium]MDR7401256.1 phosphoglycerate dehydrogenase [Armatimonadota bacterium]MDR7402986.1 phosphoglycerate dehydrogenase [Armatimonadota bacterium]MDR7437150.1 phosphoglycerate dehydrogenase [Armatimonadota bacterium]MDR7471902.1 phosphoglycerate dehydrogenase [Armatimonadota bacterium]
MKVLVADGLAPDGVRRLAERAEVVVREGLAEDQLVRALADVDALIVRSRTRVTARALARAPRLRVVARAGVGTDNIDVDAATRLGILVLNTPESSTISTAEHTMAMMLALARHLPAAHLAASRGDWRREPFTGVELYGKTLGIVGLGKIGSEVARRAAAFGMRVVAADPYVAAERAAQVGAEVLALDEVLARSDVLSLHAPLTPATHHLLGRSQFARMKRGALLVNCARGGLVDEDALLAALEEGVVAGAALDVMEREPPHDSPLLRHPRVILTPHLGASTEEAQRRVAVEVADQVLAALEGRPVRGAVNAPALRDETWQRLRPFVDLARMMGAVACQLAEGQVREVELAYAGDLASHDGAPLRAGFLAGLLEPVLDQPVNLINASVVARERGIALAEVRREDGEDSASALRVRVETSGAAVVIAGTVVGGREPRITCLDGYRMDLAPSPIMLLVWNEDRPGMIGRVGTLLGGADVNIASMHVGRDHPRGRALMVLGLDDPVPPEVAEELGRLPGILKVRVVQLQEHRPLPGADPPPS